MDLDSVLDKAKDIAGSLWRSAGRMYEKSKAEYEQRYAQGQAEASAMSDDELLHRYQKATAGAYRRALKEELESRGIEYKTE